MSNDDATEHISCGIDDKNDEIADPDETLLFEAPIANGRGEIRGG